MTTAEFLARLDNIERVAVQIAAKTAPWLTTLPTAWTIGANVASEYNWPVAIAAVSGLGLETLGVSVTSTAVRFWVYNKTRERDDDPARPFAAALVASVAYFGAAILLTGALENWTLAIFPVMSLAGSVTLALNAIDTALLERLKAKIAAEDDEKAIAKAERKAAREAAKVQETLQAPLQIAKKSAKPYERFAVEQAARNGKGPMAIDEIMTTYQVSQRTAYDWRGKYLAAKQTKEVTPY